MKNATPLSHRPGIYVTSSSMMFERGAYYGLRALLILFMISETIGFSTTEAIKVYSIFTGVLVATRIVGAVVGDFLLGSKLSMIIGVFIQALGAFSLTVGSPPFLYAGLTLVLVGGGLYSPNVLALFGKHYLDRKKLADSGFMLLYIAINIGAGLGIYFLSSASESFGFSLGFGISGILFICSGILAIFSNNTKEIKEEPYSNTITKRTLHVLAAISLVAFFWFLYELSSPQSREIQEGLLGVNEAPIASHIWQGLNSISVIIGGLILFFVWKYTNISQYMKLGVGFMLSLLAMLIFYFLSPSTNASQIVLYGSAIFLLATAELFIAPVVYSSIARYVNPKYMAIVMSATFIPSFLLTSVIGIFGEYIYQNTSVALLLSLVLSLLAGGAMFGLHFLMKDDAPVAR